MPKITEFDMVFIDYDEPNADAHYDDLLTKFPYAKRVSGVLGSDAAHKAAAQIAETERFVSVDADNIVAAEFADVEVQDIYSNRTMCWAAVNKTNGLRYGNGGLKLWSKNVVFNQRTHEATTDNDSILSQVEFCFESGYNHYNEVYSIVDITGSPLQSWRAGYREGVKSLLSREQDSFYKTFDDLKSYDPTTHSRVMTWMLEGYGVEYGLWSMIGARMGVFDALTSKNNILAVVRSFDTLTDYFNRIDQSSIIWNRLESKVNLKNIGVDIGLDSFYRASKAGVEDTYEPEYDLTMSPAIAYSDVFVDNLSMHIGDSVFTKVMSD